MSEISVYDVLEVVNNNLNNSKISNNQLDVDIFKGYVDSVTFVQTLVELEEKFNCTIPDSKLLPDEMNTINKIYKIIKDLLES